MTRNIVFDIPALLVGVPPSPGLYALRPVEHAFRRGFCRSRWSLIPAYSRRKLNIRLGFLSVSYRAVENQKIHLAGISILLFFQIAVNVKISKAKAAKVFLKQADFSRIKIDDADTKTLTNLFRQNLIQAVSA